MLKMMICMDNEKIAAEQKYHLESIYNTLNNTFHNAGLLRMEDNSGALVYRDCGRAKDFSLFWENCKPPEKTGMVYGQCICLAAVRQR